MKASFWYIITATILLWFLYFKYFNGTETSTFNFSKRDQQTVFPTPTQQLLEILPTPTLSDPEDAPIATPTSDVNPIRF